MTLTPTQIANLVEPLWLAHPECRPRLDDLLLKFDEECESSWLYSKHQTAEQWVAEPSIRRDYGFTTRSDSTGYQTYCSCDAQTAAERQEFAVDRALDAERRKHENDLDKFQTLAVNGGYVTAFYDEDQTSRLAAKAMLLGQLWGVNVEVQT